MELGTRWSWNRTRLACRIRHETGNPAVDDLRAQVRALLAKQEALNTIDVEEDDIPKAASRVGPGKSKRGSRVSTSSSQPNKMVSMANKFLTAAEEAKKTSMASSISSNVHRRYVQVPLSPPKRVQHGVTMMQTDLDKAAIDAEQDRRDYEKRNLAMSDSGTPPATEEEKLTSRPRNSNTGNAVAAAPAGARLPNVDSDGFSPSTSSPEWSRTLTGMKAYKGDIFGSSGGDFAGAMVYLSRLGNREATQALKESFLNATEQRAFREVVARRAQKFALARTKRVSLESMARTHRDRMTCLKLLSDWAEGDDNTMVLAEEGAVDAVLSFGLEDHHEIRRASAYVARVFSFKEPLLHKLIAKKAVSVLAEMTLASSNLPLAQDCGIVALNMTRTRGHEEALVDDGIVLVLTSIFAQNEPLADLCVRSLYNLTIIKESFPHVGRVLKALVQVAPRATPRGREIVLQGLLNLSERELLHKKLLEEGIVRLIETHFAVASASLEMLQMAAILLLSISRTSSCRALMIEKNVLLLLLRLAKQRDTRIVRSVLTTLYNLCIDEHLRERIVDGSSTYIVSLAVASLSQHTDAAGNKILEDQMVLESYQKAALILNLTSQVKAMRQQLVQQGSLEVLLDLWQVLDGASASSTLRFVVTALANLAAERENEVAFQSSGALKELMKRSRSESETNQAQCATAFYHLSCTRELQVYMLNDGALDVVQSFAKTERLRPCVAAIICNFTQESISFPVLGNRRILSLVLGNLRCDNDMETVKFSAISLCNLSVDESFVRPLMELDVLGVILELLQTESDDLRLEYCGAVISILTGHEEFREAGRQDGILHILLRMAASDDPNMQMRSLIGLANLSFSESCRAMMIAANVVGIVERLSHSYSEFAQLFPARVVCNLACVENSERQILVNGGLQMLMTICMVRSVSISSKQYCATAIRNLLNTDTAVMVISEGIIAVVTSIARSLDKTCLTVGGEILLFLASLEDGAHAILDKNSSINFICEITKTNKDPDIRDIYGRIVCNLFHSGLKGISILAGGSGISALVSYAQMCPESMQLSVAAILHKLLRSDERVNQVLHMDGVPKVLNLYRACSSTLAAELCLVAIYRIFELVEGREQLLQGSIVLHILHDVDARFKSPSHFYPLRCLFLIGNLIADICLESEHSRRQILGQGGVKLIPLLITAVTSDATDATIAPELRFVEVVESLNQSIAVLTESEDVLHQFAAQDGIQCLETMAARLAVVQASPEDDEDSKDSVMNSVKHVMRASYSLCRHARYQKASTALLEPLLNLRLNSESQGLLVGIFVEYVKLGRVADILNHKVVDIVNVALENAGAEDDTSIQNCCGVLYFMTTSPKGCELLLQRGSLQHLLPLVSSPNEHAKACVAEAIKNLSRRAGDRVESDIVKALLRVVMQSSQLETDLTLKYLKEVVFRDVTWPQDNDFEESVRAKRKAVLRLYADLEAPEVLPTRIALQKQPGGPAAKVPPIPVPEELKEEAANRYPLGSAEWTVPDSPFHTSKLDVPAECFAPPYFDRRAKNSDSKSDSIGLKRGYSHGSLSTTEDSDTLHSPLSSHTKISYASVATRTLHRMRKDAGRSLGMPRSVVASQPNLTAAKRRKSVKQRSSAVQRSLAPSRRSVDPESFASYVREVAQLWGESTLPRTFYLSRSESAEELLPPPEEEHDEDETDTRSVHKDIGAASVSSGATLLNSALGSTSSEQSAGSVLRESELELDIHDPENSGTTASQGSPEEGTLELLSSAERFTQRKLALGLYC